MSERKEIKPVLKNKWHCFIGGKTHKAYLHSNCGAIIIWCKKHGILASCTNTFKDGSDKQMTKTEYEKFVLEREGVKK